jgi:MYXO-CTERM domain-containing protein
MTVNNDNNKPDNMELLKKEAAECGPGCGCHTGGSSGRTRMIVGAVVLIAAGVLIARAVIKNNSAVPGEAAYEFAPLPAMQASPSPAAGTALSTDAAPAAPAAVPVQELGALNELNTVAADTMGVFVFLAAKNDPPIKAPLAQMRSAAKMIEAQGQKVGLFTLKTDSRDYAQVASQVAVPCVIAMVKGRGMVPVSGEITESKLVQGFVAASSAGGGCGAGGCGPGAAGCN